MKKKKKKNPMWRLRDTSIPVALRSDLIPACVCVWARETEIYVSVHACVQVYLHNRGGVWTICPCKYLFECVCFCVCIRHTHPLPPVPGMMYGVTLETRVIHSTCMCVWVFMYMCICRQWRFDGTLWASTCVFIIYVCISVTKYICKRVSPEGQWTHRWRRWWSGACWPHAYSWPHRWR